MFPKWPLVLAANRDEFYERATDPPHLINSSPAVFAGRDAVAGGTWMGVRPDGFFAALTNQPTGDKAGPCIRSRGQLVLELLRQENPMYAAQWLENLPLVEYDHFNLIFGDSSRVYLGHGHAQFQWAEVPDGLSVLTNGHLNSGRFPKVERVKRLWEQLRGLGVEPMMALQQILGDVEKPTTLRSAPNQETLPIELRRALHAICVHTPLYGTRSATILAVSKTGALQYLYADGPPSTTPFTDITFELDTAFNL
jgi:uncharacterized protein with NRDE domain